MTATASDESSGRPGESSPESGQHSIARLDAETIRRLVASGDDSALDRFEAIDDEAAVLLGSWTHMLLLDGLTELSESAAEALARSSAPVLSLGKLERAADEVIRRPGQR